LGKDKNPSRCTQLHLVDCWFIRGSAFWNCGYSKYQHLLSFFPESDKTCEKDYE